MIDLRGGRFTDIMPGNLSSQLETQAFAYALSRQIQRLCAYADGVRIYAAVDTMPERILDVLAVELRTPVYHEDYSVDVKRTLIKGTIAFYSKMGTPGAVNWVVRSVFEGGRIEEWFEYGGDPHYFRVSVNSTGRKVTAESLSELKREIASIKRKSSWLDGIITVTDMPTELYLAPAMGPALSSTELPRLEPPTRPAAVYASAALWGGIAIRELPRAGPVFKGARTVRFAPALGGSFSITRLPVLLRPAKLSAAAVLGGSLSVTNLPNKERKEENV